MSILFNIKGGSKKDMLQLLSAYQQVVDLNVICSVTDPLGDIIYVNDNFCEVSKYSRNELLGQNHRILNSGYHSPDFFKVLWLTISNGHVWRGEVKSMAKDGSFFWLDSTIVPILNESGKITEYFSIRIPINDRKKIEEERQAYVKSLEEKIFMTSHQVRQPISQILGIATVLEGAVILDEEQVELISFLKQSALTLDTFTRELTNFMHELRQENKNDGENQVFY